MKPRFVRAVLGFRFSRFLALASCFWMGLACHGALYLQLEGIEGDVTDRDHEGWIAVDSMQWGVENTRSAVGGSGGGIEGKTTISALTLTKNMDRSSAVLFAQSCSGEVIPQAKLQVTRQTPEGEEIYFEILLERVMISSYSVSSGGSGEPSLDEVFSLIFSKIQIIYSSKESGTIERGWDLEYSRPA